MIATTTFDDDGNIASLTSFDGELLVGGTSAGTLRRADPEDGTYVSFGLGAALDALVALPGNVAARTSPRTSPGGADLATYALDFADLAPVRSVAVAATSTATPLRASDYFVRHGFAFADAGEQPEASLATIASRGADIGSASGTLRLSADDVARGFTLRSNRRGALKLVDPDGQTVARDLISITAR